MVDNIRVLMTKSAMDGHDRGLKVVSKALSDAGMEVILHQYNSVDEIVKTAAEEDVDIIGLSFYCAGLPAHAPILMEQLKSKGMIKVLVIVGGVIPDSDIPQLLNAGVSQIFRTGSSTTEIVNYIREKVKKQPQGV